VRHGGSEGAIDKDGSFAALWGGESLTAEIIFNAFKGTHFRDILHMQSIDLVQCIMYIQQPT
jgi:hypothetical protein